MRQSLTETLICPACLPQEKSLRLECHEGQGEDVEQGLLRCIPCGRTYPVREGIAVLLVDSPSASDADPYTQPQSLSAYLWSHFADLWDDPDATDAYRRWADLLRDSHGPFLDVGCAVGRMTLEMAADGEAAWGIDRSPAFIGAARTLARHGTLSFELIEEGDLSESRTIALPPRLRGLDVEFLVADALALPFPNGFFRRVASLNLLDKVAEPRRHLAELDRVARSSAAALLVSDPYSWSRAYAAPEQWLGGTRQGPWAGRGSDNLRRILATQCAPPWHSQEQGTVTWSIRNHARHFEQIRSHYVLAER
ncbi:class I SAM-dependent methyltransferase [Geoalkalibacter halelectricus]|uniref:Methyltransferase domain-containing protein n=1 Tax=Geoalkalibacter halelectricus TaxID=2847045 RepID=A0ABY5ZIV0_9BACT|nr:methyltransferase domain-containing protein [Geoalkalibacter halelectricus]MDO3378926.1 methyltransferase domain-containing protein [Geoalkalibacter halelectricus]UWZ79051.1 methyltransferase domain-containing protein [Geoalkalibacter halelectricus]